MTAETVVPPPNESPPPPSAPRGLVSLLVPCCGQLEYTRLLVPSLLRHTFTPFELIFLDVGSLDGTADYLAGVQAAARVRVEIVRTPTDLGLPAACREALARARGDEVVLLNNDTVVTDDWLGQLTALASLAPAIGLVGPMSNHAAPPQLVEAVPYRIGAKRATLAGGDGAAVDLDGVNRFAHDWREQHRGQWLETDRLGGFCLLVKRPVLALLEPAADASGLAVFDTSALCRKARQAGYTLACCKDLFIHHFGSRTFAHGGPAVEGAASAI
jgi:GT2 family glycosyltransferase